MQKWVLSPIIRIIEFWQFLSGLRWFLLLDWCAWWTVRVGVDARAVSLSAWPRRCVCSWARCCAQPPTRLSPSPTIQNTRLKWILFLKAKKKNMYEKINIYSLLLLSFFLREVQVIFKYEKFDLSSNVLFMCV